MFKTQLVSQQGFGHGVMSITCKSVGHRTDVVDVIYQTWETMYDHISKQWKRFENTMRSGVLLTNFMVFEMWSKNILGVWYVFSIETKTKA